MSETETRTNPLAAKFPDLKPHLDQIAWAECEFEQVPRGMSSFAIMSEHGDTKHIWDPNKPQEVEAARTLYDSLTKKGYRAFQVKGKNGDQGDQMDRFDPDAGRVIFVPAMQGG